MKLKVVLNEKEEIDLNRIDGLSSLSQSTSDNSSPQYGIIANTGSIELIDTDGKFEDMINNGELPPSSVSADIYIDDKLVQKHITTDSTYDKNGNELQISLSNSVELLNNMVFSGINYEGTPLTAYDILFRVFSEYYGSDFTEDKFKELMSENIVYGLEDELYGPIYSYLKNITLEYPYVESGRTYVDVINDFCAMAQLQMYVDTDGYIKATSARPVIGEWNYLTAYEDAQMSDIKEDLFVKNKYNGVEISENKFSFQKNFDTTIASIEKTISESDMTKLEEKITKKYDIQNMAEYPFELPGARLYAESFIYSKCQYSTYSGSQRFSKKSNNNLEEITKIYDNLGSGEDLSYSLTYFSGSSNASADLEVKTYGDWGENMSIGSISNETVGTVSYGEIPKTGKIEGDAFKYKVTFSRRDKYLQAESPSTLPYSSEKIKITDEGDSFLVEYTVVCAKKQTTYYGYSISKNIHTKQGESGPYTNVRVNGFCEQQYATELSININGENYTISFNQEIIKTTPTSGNANVLTYQDSAFITDKTKYNGVKISSLIANKLLKDYSNGVKTAQLTTSLKNISGTNNEGYISKDKTYLIQIADIIYPRKESDGMLSWGDSTGRHYNRNINVYKTTGFNLVYDGEILNNLELMKVKYVPPIFNYQYDEINDGYIVTSNPEHSYLTELTIPSSYDDGVHGVKDVVEIGWEAFTDFNKLTSVIIPHTVSKISTRAFDNCSSLKYIVLPYGLKEIGTLSFGHCTGIERFDIPDTVTRIFSHAFVGCSSDTIIYCNVSEKPEEFYNEWNAYNYAGDELETVFISPLTFEDYNGTWKVTGLTDETVKYLTIPDRYNGVAVTSIADSAFENNTQLRTVKIGNNITKIGNYAFGTCRSLYQVTLGTSVSSIGTEAFRYCDKLVSVINNSSLSFSAGSTNYGYIGYYMLNNISEIKKINGFVIVDQRLGAASFTSTLISYDGDDINIILPTTENFDGYEYSIAYNILKFAFYHCKFESVTIGSNVGSFGETVFYKCSNLKNVYFADDSVITSLPTGTFYGCSSLESLAIPNSVTSVGSSAFDGCSSMRKVYIPSSVKTMEASQSHLAMFRGCSSTLKIYCGASAKQSGWGTYWNYYNASSQLSVTYNTTRAQYDAK